MTAISLTTVAVVALALLATAIATTVAGIAARRTVRGLHRRLDALEAAVSPRAATVPEPRSAVSPEEIRGAVAEALAEERERELAEARAFWAAQDARDLGTESGPTMAGHGTEYEVAPEPAPSVPSDLEAALLDALLEGAFDQPAEGEVFIPRQAGADGSFTQPQETDGGSPETTGNEQAAESPELAAARRRHPSHPDFGLRGEPVDPENAPGAPAAAPAIADAERTMEWLGEIAEAGVPLRDVRQGPLGTLDVYVFADGTTVCLSPGHPETAGRLCEALRDGDTPLLVGGSGTSGAYTLTFSYGEGRIAYLLADRVIASL